MAFFANLRFFGEVWFLLSCLIGGAFYVWIILDGFCLALNTRLLLLTV
jgi:hypothetical protein